MAACDVYKRNLDNGLAIMAKQGNQATGYADYRQVLDRKDIDVVFVATPDHWHAPLIAAACQAGKDVYCEKPLANTMEDCKMAVDAAAKYNRVVQIGLQQRSMELFKNGAALLKDNAIGPAIAGKHLVEMLGEPAVRLHTGRFGHDFILRRRVAGSKLRGSMCHGAPGAEWRPQCIRSGFS